MQADEKRREAALLRGVEYLERYFTLIAFAAYVHHPSFDGASFNTEDGSFQAWLDRRPELHSILRRLLWRNPMGALMPPTLPLPGVVVAQVPTPDGGEAADAVVSGRAGGVLGAHCILKEEPYPGVQSSRVPVFHDGAPNLRQVCCAVLPRGRSIGTDLFLLTRLCRIRCTVLLSLRWTAFALCSKPPAHPLLEARPCSGTTCARSHASTLPAARLCFGRRCVRWQTCASVRAPFCVAAQLRSLTLARRHWHRLIARGAARGAFEA